MNKNCTLKLVNEISLYYDARSKNIKIWNTNLFEKFLGNYAALLS